jgi:hypothetical protein
MTHPHRINICTNGALAMGMLVGLVQGILAVVVPGALAWYFLGDYLSGMKPAPTPKQIEVRIGI